MPYPLNKKSGYSNPAKTISTITNPCLLSVVMLLVITIIEANRFVRFVEWSVTLVLLLVVLPALYTYLRIRFNRDNKNFQYLPMLFLKSHPQDILILGLIVGLPCWVILKVLDAPPVVLITLIALLVTAMVVALVNLYYRASFHLAGIAVLIYVTIATWGSLFILLTLIVPPAIWAKYRLHDHTITQMLLGIVLGLAATATILYWP
jgi:hypothetical protein